MSTLLLGMAARIMLFDHIYNEDIVDGAKRLPDASIDLIIADPPYNLGKDYGNDSDKRGDQDYLDWSKKWINAVVPKLKETGSLYIFLTWRYAPEIFTFLKQQLTMVNEIIWDRRVPSMGGTTRRFTSVHDNIGFFAKNKKAYYFDLDPVRIPYDPQTKKKRTRALFAGSKWLELGYNPKDVWSIARIHKQDPEREDHPTQKPLAVVERMILSSCPKEGVVLDPFLGSGTTAEACLMHNRRFIGFEVNQSYCNMAQARVERARKNRSV